MRRAAGIILIILGVFRLVWVIIGVIGMSDFDLPSSSPYSVSVSITLWGLVFSGIVWCGLLVAGGVLCLKRRYWGLCLVSALLILSTNIFPAVELLLRGNLSMPTFWVAWILVVGALVSTIFISLRKKEWQETSDIMDSKASNDG